MKLKKSSIALLVGALTLAFGTALVARALMRPPPPVTIVKEVEVARPPATMVLVAARELAAGEFVDSSMLTWAEPSSSTTRLMQFTAAGESEQRQLEKTLYSAALRRAVPQGEAVTRDSLVHVGEPGFLSTVLSQGMRAVSVPTSAVASNAGLVSAGDWVDVILSVDRTAQPASPEQTNPYQSLASQTILHRVRVLALNNNVAGIAPPVTPEVEDASKNGRPGTAAGAQSRSARAYYETITLEVTPADAERLAVAKEIGVLQVALLSINDVAEGEDGGTPAMASVTSPVTRLADTTAIFNAKGKAAPAVVKTYHGRAQSALTFEAQP